MKRFLLIAEEKGFKLLEKFEQKVQHPPANKKPTQSEANEMRKFKIHFDVWKCRQSSPYK